MSCNHQIEPYPNCDRGHETATDVYIDACQTQVRVDITLPQHRPVQIFGEVHDQCGRPVHGALLTLVKVHTDRCGQCQYQEIAQATSDCSGMYYFEVYTDGQPACYKVFAYQSSLYGQSACPQHPCNAPCRC